MRKTVLTYGLISGILAAALMVATVPFIDRLGRWGAIAGYTGILVAALMVFFGVRSYRDRVGEGRLTFGRGFAVGILITLITCAFYVVTWEILYFGVIPDLGDKVAAAMVEGARSSGATAEKITEVEQQARTFKRLYDNPVLSVPLVFIEPFPVGLAVTLLSAALLRRRSVVP
jgi:hypothetical protein